jgi:hypothetical protein
MTGDLGCKATNLDNISNSVKLKSNSCVPAARETNSFEKQKYTRRRVGTHETPTTGAGLKRPAFLFRPSLLELHLFLRPFNASAEGEGL